MNDSRNVSTLLVAIVLTPVLALTCTGFLLTGEDGVLFGNNEDFWNTNTRMWFVPAEDGGYGAVFFGFDDGFPQGGMNEAGLAYDGFATRPKPVTGSTDKPAMGYDIIQKVMAECATVEDVIEVFSTYNLAMMERAMLMFADATGDSVIIEGDEFIRKSGAFQVVTNFYQSDDPSGANAYGEGKSCGRFEIANEMLGDVKRVNIADARRVLNAVHAEGVSRTLYSNIYDLDDRIVYVYNFHDFENEVVIDLAEELKKGARVVELPTLFPRNYAREHFVAQQEEDIAKRREERGSVEVATDVLQRYVGKYSGDDGEIDIALEDGILHVKAPAMEALRLTPTSDTEFYDVTLMMDYDVVFRVADGGEVDAVDVTGSREEYTLVEMTLVRVD